MAKPSDVPHWADSPTTLRTEPAEGVKDAGFSVLTKLPAQYFNWLIGTICDWLVWITSYVDFSILGVDVTGRVTATTSVEAGDYINPSNANDTRVLSDATGLRVEDAVGGLRPVSCSSVMVPVRTSTIQIPSTSIAVANPSSTPGWNFSPGTDPDYIDDDHLVSITASAVCVADVVVPQGSKIVAVWADWKPYSTSPSTKMKFNAWKVKRFSETSARLHSGGSTLYGAVEAAGSTDRALAVMTPDQNNTEFNNSFTGEGNTVRIRVQASSDGASGDRLFGLYVEVAHYAIGIYSEAEDAT